MALVAAHDEPLALLAEVDEQVGVAQRGQAPVVVAERLGDQVLVGEGTIGRRTPASRPTSARVHAAGVHQDLALDVAPLVRTPTTRPRRPRCPFHARVGEDATTALARALGQRVGELGGVQVTVGGQVDGPQDALGGHEREQLGRLLGGDRARGAARRSAPRRPGGGAPPGARGRRPGAATPPPSSRSPRPQPPVELDRPHHHPRERHRPAQLADQPRGVEGGAAGELVAVHEHDVALAQLREVVGDGRAAHPAAHDHHAGAVGQLTRPRHAPASPRSGGSARWPAAARSARRRRPGSRSRCRRPPSGRRPTSPRGSPTSPA